MSKLGRRLMTTCITTKFVSGHRANHSSFLAISQITHDYLWMKSTPCTRVQKQDSCITAIVSEPIYIIRDLFFIIQALSLNCRAPSRGCSALHRPKTCIPLVSPRLKKNHPSSETFLPFPPTAELGLIIKLFKPGITGAQLRVGRLARVAPCLPFRIPFVTLSFIRIP